ncbi:hypothetical protein [Nostoc sp.]|uniref:hypothetical protein n=1 Tax=Nostoc sp. TaxID=1180 RepID=UPI002FF513FB
MQKFGYLSDPVSYTIEFMLDSLFVVIQSVQAIALTLPGSTPLSRSWDATAAVTPLKRFSQLNMIWRANKG